MKYCSDINIGPGYRICEERAPVELIRRIKSEVKAFQVGILKARSPRGRPWSLGKCQSRRTRTHDLDRKLLKSSSSQSPRACFLPYTRFCFHLLKIQFTGLLDLKVNQNSKQSLSRVFTIVIDCTMSYHLLPYFILQETFSKVWNRERNRTKVQVLPWKTISCQTIRPNCMFNYISKTTLLVISWLEKHTTAKYMYLSLSIIFTRNKI